jgi:hypothetical protein
VQVDVSDRSVPVLPPESVPASTKRSGTDGPKPVINIHAATAIPDYICTYSLYPLASSKCVKGLVYKINGETKKCTQNFAAETSHKVGIRKIVFDTVHKY